VDATADVDEFTGHVCRGLRAAGIPRVVALNKCDCDDACPEHIRTSLGSEEESICISALSREDAYRALEHLVNHIHSCHTNHRFRYVPG
jgi:signal recognition particle receptor subunit beta